MITFILLLLTIFLGLVCILATYLIIKLFIFKVPLVSSGKKTAQKMMEMADLSENQKIYDLGCGTGIILFEVEKKFPNNVFVGYEILKPALWFARTKKSLLSSKVEFKCEDFFKADLSDANIIFCYLWPSVMDRFFDEKWAELKPKTKVVSHGFRISNLTPINTYKSEKIKIFVYEK